VDVEFLERDDDAPQPDEAGGSSRRRRLLTGLALLVAAASVVVLLAIPEGSPPPPHRLVDRAHASAPWVAELAVKAALPLGPGYQVLNGVGCPQVGTAGLRGRLASRLAKTLSSGRVIDLQPAIDKMGGLCGVELRAQMPGATVVVVAQAVRGPRRGSSVEVGELAVRSAVSVHRRCGSRWTVDVSAIGRAVPSIAELAGLAAAVGSELRSSAAGAS
jgi:hypothetical protein